MQWWSWVFKQRISSWGWGLEQSEKDFLPVCSEGGGGALLCGAVPGGLSWPHAAGGPGRRLRGNRVPPARGQPGPAAGTAPPVTARAAAAAAGLHRWRHHTAWPRPHQPARPPHAGHRVRGARNFIDVEFLHRNFWICIQNGRLLEACACMQLLSSTQQSIEKIMPECRVTQEWL